MHFLLLLFFISLTVLKAQVTNTTVFPLNEYLTTENGSPYPVLVQSKLDAIDTTKFVNVMDYGAKGDGITWDDDAIEKAFNAAAYGVIFPAGKTFLVSRRTEVHLTHDLTIYAYGATIKMDDLRRYSFLQLEYEPESYHGTVIWLGGKLWGNKKNQSWPGSPTGNNEWAEDHGRLLGICYAEFALVKDVQVIGPVMDGVALEACKLGVIADSRAFAGAPIKFSQVEDQGTYFKCTRAGSQAFYCINLKCDGGSIGVQYSTKYVEDNSLAVINNCSFTNQSQDALHFEDCKKIFIYKSSVEREIDGDYQADVHLSNSTQIASIKNCYFRNAKVDFRNGSNLEIGVIDSCNFVSEFTGKESSSLFTCLAGATHCINSTFTGKTATEQAWADNVQNCHFNNFDDLALRGPHVTYSSHFENGSTPISAAKDGVIVNCTFDNVGNSDYNRKPDKKDKEWKAPFSSLITIVDNKSEYLGTITCGEAIDDKDDDLVDETTDIITGTVDTVIQILTPLVSNPTATARVASPTSNSNANRYAESDDFEFDTAHHQSIAFSSTINKSLTGKNTVGTESSAIKLYPNPAVNEVHVTLNDKVWGKTVLNIYDQQGRLIQSKTVYKNTATSVESINVRSLSAGTYVLHIINERQQSSLKFIVAK